MKCQNCGFINSDYSYKCVKCGIDLSSAGSKQNMQNNPAIQSSLPPVPTKSKISAKNQGRNVIHKKQYSRQYPQPQTIYHPQSKQRSYQPYKPNMSFSRIARGLFRESINSFLIGSMAFGLSFFSPYKQIRFFIFALFIVITVLSIVLIFKKIFSSTFETQMIRIFLRIVIILTWIFAIFFNWK